VKEAPGEGGGKTLDPGALKPVPDTRSASGTGCDRVSGMTKPRPPPSFLRTQESSEQPSGAAGRLTVILDSIQDPVIDPPVQPDARPWIPGQARDDVKRWRDDG